MTTPRMGTIWRLSAVLLAVGLVAAACAADDGASDTAASAMSQAQVAEGDAGRAQTEAQAAAAQAAQAQAAADAAQAAAALAQATAEGNQAAVAQAEADLAAAQAAADAARADAAAAQQEADDARTAAEAAADAAAEAAMPMAGCDGLTEVVVQLQWFTQSQFAGYYAAHDQGLYEDLCLDVTILEGGVEIVPIPVLDSGGADFAVSWVPRALVPREEGADVVNIAQIFERSATLQVSWADSGITSVEDLAGKTVGNWGFGNEFELLAGLRRNGIDPDSDVTLVQQNFDMSALLNREIDAAQAMIYNEYAQVLEAINPDTGELYQPSDLVVIDWNDVGTAMLQDAIWADADRLDSDAAYRDTAVRFVQGTLAGWIWCRDNPDACVDVVLDNAPTLGRSHQTWQLNEISALIWPSSGGIGVMDEDLWNQTVDVAVAEGILSAEPVGEAYRTDIVSEAIANLQAGGLDTDGRGWSRVTVVLNEGGE